jgi:hypothetical protein
MNTKPKKLYNLKMIADKAHIPVQTIVAWYHRGKLPPPTWILDSGKGRGQAIWADYDIEPIFEKIDTDTDTAAQSWLSK